MKFKFCPKCAGELKVEGAGHEKVPVCQKCGFRFYQNSKPCTGAVILDEQNRVMMGKRAKSPHLHKWDLLGGFLNDGEDSIEGTKREIMEELGVECKIGEVVTIVVDRYGLAKDDFNTINIFYKVKLLSQDFTPNEEIAEIKWFSQNEIPWKKLAFRNTTIALKVLFKVK